MTCMCGDAYAYTKSHRYQGVCDGPGGWSDTSSSIVRPGTGPERKLPVAGCQSLNVLSDSPVVHFWAMVLVFMVRPPGPADVQTL